MAIKRRHIITKTACKTGGFRTLKFTYRQLDLTLPKAKTYKYVFKDL